MIASALSLACPAAARAHAPIFIPAAESHGAHAFDLHVGVHRMGTDSYEVEQMWGMGLRRDLTVHVGAGTPLLDGKFKSIDEVMLGGSWIFWSRDKFQAKQALALQLSGQFHEDRDSGTGDISLGRSFPAALAYGMERRYWNLFASIRALPRGRSAEDGESEAEAPISHHIIGIQHIGSGEPNTKGGSESSHKRTESKYAGWVDLGYAYRLVDVAKHEMDLMLFMGSSARLGHHFAQYLSPELWIGPNGRMLFKIGYQFPVIQHDEDASKRGQWAYEVELRF